jgi:hypothetical protein
MGFTEQTFSGPFIKLVILFIITNRNRMTSPIAAPFPYNSTAQGLIGWTLSELEHVGRIASIEDENIQYAYALSTVNGMAHLKDALYEYISKNKNKAVNHDMLVYHEQVVRVMRHLIKTYSVNIETIEKFNTRKTLSPLNYLKKAGTAKKNSRTRVNKPRYQKRLHKTTRRIRTHKK